MSNIENLGLKQFYNEHTDYVTDIIERSVFNEDKRKKALSNTFQNSVHSLMWIHDFVWGKIHLHRTARKTSVAKIDKGFAGAAGID